MAMMANKITLFCDACRPCHLILSILKPVSPNLTDLLHLQLAQETKLDDFRVHDEDNNDNNNS